ncbi:lactonase family protein [Cellulomonas sp. APG4]|uniref:lactonase family protein n=1 Tax=Cellulomonas sp. APG4 TaxID=1538656 RepID=UPI001379A8DA|nr:beta-propeller fold lactonase family protein [Cellulomonas sp. APG4]NCT91922.1 lactonase family protein [Cellulomonas sp. APG4]
MSSSAAVPGTQRTLWVGTYPAGGPGAPSSGEGVWRLTLDTGTGGLTGHLAVRTPSPSFLASSGRHLLVVEEGPEGAVTQLTPDADGETVLTARVSSGGGDPCHVLVHPDGRAAYVANYGAGSLAVLTLDPDGGLSEAVRGSGGPVQLLGGRGSGPVAGRQDGPHVHSATLAPGGRHLLVADLGTDELRRHTVRPDGTLEDDGYVVRLPAGTGPRHLAPGPDGHLYVVGELSATVHVLAWDATTGEARHVQAQPVSRTAAPARVDVHPSHPVLVTAAPDDEVLVVGVRGTDVLARHAVRDGGSRLEHLADQPLPGTRPRHLAVVPRAAPGVGAWTVVALQDSDEVVSLTPDGDVAGRCPVPRPACVVPA